MAACVELEGNADAVEFCPTPPFCHILAAATYTLQEASGERLCPSRLGTLSLFHLDLSCGHGDLKLLQIHLLHTCGIFDIKWRPPSSHPMPPLLAQASADGTLALYEFRASGSPYLRELSKDSTCSSMCLSLDWNPHSKQHIALSHSDGSLSVADIRESHVEVSHRAADAHSFEAWCAAYDSCRRDILYSGGDDCHFCGWDMRQGLSKPIFREKKSHSMGVTSIQANPCQENLLATGSYDEKLRIWDARMTEKPVAEKVLEMGGGVWKLKWNPHDSAFLAAACMHNGFMIVKMLLNEPTIALEYKKHGSLAYGVDWFKGVIMPEDMAEKDAPSDCGEHEKFPEGCARRFSTVMASCSFYDRALHVWKPDLYS